MTTKLAELPGMRDLWSETLGDPRIRVAVLDGPMDRGHPCFAGAKLSGLETRFSDAVDGGRMSAHGTHVASVIFGQPGSPVHGIAPKCSGLLGVIYSDGTPGPTSQMDLAHAIHQAVQAGAQVVNISGGELSSTGHAEPMLAEAVRHCQDRGVLIVAAAGNDACQCLHVPAALPSVLAVGAMDERGRPLDSSNWGDVYRSQGILAPGRNILGAVPGGGTIPKSGTSYATPVVTGIAALLLSGQLARGEKPDPLAVGKAILAGAIPCNEQLTADCRRFLAGRLNIPGARALISKQRRFAMSVERNAGDVGSLAGSTQVESRPENGVTAQQEPEAARLTAVQPSSESPAIHPATADQASQNESVVSTPRMSAAAVAPSSNGAHVTRSSSSLEPMASSVTPSCSCNGNGNKRLVYALGTLGYDFGTEACRDGFKSLMPYVTGTADGGLIPYIEQEDVEPEMPPYPPNPYDPHQMVNYLAGYPPYGPPYPIQGGFPTLGARFTQPLPEEIAPPPFPPPMPKPPDPYPGYQGYPGYPAHITDAKELIWTLNIELTPVYAIRPHGSYGAEAYQLLVGFLAGQIRSSTDKDWYISRVAIPGVLTGETVRLFSGQVVPVIVPQIRGMASWNVTKLILTSLKTLEIAPDDAARRGPVERQIRGYLNRVYYLLRNLGQAPADRAINYTATNVVQIAGIIAEQLEKEGVNPVLDSIVAQRSPFCRIDSDCWDVSVTFFDADNLLTARDQYLFTVDVREAYPVFVGPYRHFLVPR